jgi:hypothetical protein
VHTSAVTTPRRPRSLGWAVAVTSTFLAIVLARARPRLLDSFDEALAFERTSAEGSMDGVNFSTTPGTGPSLMVFILIAMAVPAIVVAAAWAVAAHRYVRASAPPRRGAVAFTRLLVASLTGSVVGLVALAAYAVLAWRLEASQRALANVALLGVVGGSAAAIAAVCCFEIITKQERRPRLHPPR